MIDELEQGREARLDIRAAGETTAATPVKR